MVYKAWQCGSAGVHLSCAGCGLKQRQQWWLDLEDNPSAERRDQREVANELDCVAQALLRVQQDGLAIQLLTIPLGLLEFSWPQTQFAKLPTPLVPLPTLTKVSFAQASERKVVLRACTIWIELQAVPIVAFHLLAPVECEERV